MFIGALSMFFLYKDLKKYSIYPLIGLCAYISRFFINRNLSQIRAGLAYLIVIWGIKYIHEKNVALNYISFFCLLIPLQRLDSPTSLFHL